MASLDASADEIRALLELTQRIPMTRAEALFCETIFTRWLDTLAPAGAASASDVLAPGLSETQPPTISTSDQPSGAIPAFAPAPEHTDQVQSTQNS